ncbi:MAG: phage integrase SAM-like domain-containing protein [Saprospiraceae bacterium]|nr:phage integrase SAM-like domain-containing protein [Saprospiraceae bacterium]MBK8851134.1 phage integrase SAM-like domain-containing protein [Saprospiraceae bacterium]
MIYKTRPIRKVLFSKEEKYWDEKNGRVKTAHPLYMEYNELITYKLHDVERRCITAVRNNQEFTRELLFDATTDGYSLVYIVIGYGKKMAMKKKHVAKEKYDNIVKKKTEFSPDVKLSQVTTKWLNKYRAFLEEKNSNNAASKNISMLLTSLQEAAKDIQLDLRLFGYRVS